MKPLARRLYRWNLYRWKMVTLFIAVVALSTSILTAERRGRWLCQAALGNQTTKAKILVWLGTDVNSQPHGQESALHGAAYQGNTELMSFLIQHGAAIDQTAKWGITPLFRARVNHQAAAEQLLITNGANPDTSGVKGP